MPTYVVFCPAYRHSSNCSNECFRAKAIESVGHAAVGSAIRPTGTSGRAGDSSGYRAQNGQERAKNRYQSIKRDSEKLLELATELKQYVDKSGESVLSMDVVKKCDEIEKLSKSVRAKMKGE